MCSFAEKSYNRQHKSNHSYEGDLRKLKFENTVVVCGKTEMLTYLPTMNSFFHFIFLSSWNHPIQNATLLHTGQGMSRMSPWGAVHRWCFLVQIIVNSGKLFAFGHHNPCAWDFGEDSGFSFLSSVSSSLRWCCPFVLVNTRDCDA